MAKWKEVVFLLLEVTDLGKDLMYLFFQPDDYIMAFCFAQTIIVPFIYNVWTTNVVRFTDKNGNEVEIRETALLTTTARTHVGLQQASEDGKIDLDSAEKRY